MNDTRTRMVQAAVHALQRDGVAGMSFSDVLAASGAARGAIYHHFPAGKTQLVAEAATANAEEVTRGLQALTGSSALDVVDAFLTAVRPVVAASASGAGCAVAAVTVGDEDGDQILKPVAASAFASWTQVLAERLAGAGLPDDQASDLATTLVILLEGAQVLCRAAGTLEPFERAARIAIAFTQQL